MIKAKTRIIVGGKIFQDGQTVTGLSRMDKQWMLDAGYITETAGKKEVEESQLSEEKKAYE